MSDEKVPLRGSFKAFLTNLFGGNRLDITQYIVYMTVHSSLDDPMMTASVILSDENSLMSSYPVDGDASIIITMEAGNGELVSGLFHINSYSNVPQNNRKSQAVKLMCVSAEHIHNASQKIQEYQYWYNPKPISEIVKDIGSKYLGTSVQGSASSSPAVNINIPRMHPLQAISFLNERATGGGKSLFTFYQKFDDGKIKFFNDEVSQLAVQEPKWEFVLNETSTGEGARLIDELYVDGSAVSKIISYRSDTQFNTHNMIKQGYASRTYVKMDFINKTVETFDDKSQHTVVGKKQMPDVVGFAQNNADFTENRTLYEPFNGDDTYYIDPVIEDSFKTSKPVAAGLLGKRLTITTYGCPDVNPGDVVKTLVPEFNSSEDRPLDTQYTKNYLVYATQHAIDTNGDFQSKYELVSDGQE